MKKAQHRIIEAEMNQEYAPIIGEAPFGKLSANLALGEGKFIRVLFAVALVAETMTLTCL